MFKETFRKYKGTIIAASVVTLLPVLAGLLVWDRLPDMIATHFGLNGEANGWSSKAVTVFGIPFFLILMELIMIAAVSTDPKKYNISGGLFRPALWIIPASSILVSFISLGTALGMELDVGMICIIFVGVIFIVLGISIPKARRNYTAGVRIPWTLSDDENWNRTNRLAGRLFLISGILMLVTSPLKSPAVMIILIIAASFIPVIYSFILYRNTQEKD